MERKLTCRRKEMPVCQITERIWVVVEAINMRKGKLARLPGLAVARETAPERAAAARYTTKKGFMDFH